MFLKKIFRRLRKQPEPVWYPALGVSEIEALVRQAACEQVDRIFGVNMEGWVPVEDEHDIPPTAKVVRFQEGDRTLEKFAVPQEAVDSLEAIWREQARVYTCLRCKAQDDEFLLVLHRDQGQAPLILFAESRRLQAAVTAAVFRIFCKRDFCVEVRDFKISEPEAESSHRRRRLELDGLPGKMLR